VYSLSRAGSKPEPSVRTGSLSGMVWGSASWQLGALPAADDMGVLLERRDMEQVQEKANRHAEARPLQGCMWRWEY